MSRNVKGESHQKIVKQKEYLRHSKWSQRSNRDDAEGKDFGVKGSATAKVKGEEKVVLSRTAKSACTVVLFYLIAFCDRCHCQYEQDKIMPLNLKDLIQILYVMSCSVMHAEGMKELASL